MTPEELDNLIQQIRENVRERLRRVRVRRLWWESPVTGKRPLPKDE